MDLTNGNKIILASASPRRRELLEKAGIDFEVVVSDAEEIAGGNLPPREVAIENARRKALGVAKLRPNRIVLGADTVVALGGDIYGKPRDEADAKRMLSILRGKTHSVFTGVCAARAGADGSLEAIADFRESRVSFKNLSDGEIDEYLRHVYVLDKAGAYAAQECGGMIIEKIDGDFDNVMGLPVGACKKILDTLAARAHT